MLVLMAMQPLLSIMRFMKMVAKLLLFKRSPTAVAVLEVGILCRLGIGLRLGNPAVIAHYTQTYRSASAVSAAGA